MKLGSKTILRLTRIAAHLKQNDYPSKKSLCEEFRRLDLDNDDRSEYELGCTPRTVQRDIAVLKDHFGCPVRYSRENRGYYLSRHDWEFVAPAILDENEMLAAVLGAKIAGDMFPEPVRSRIVNAVDEMLKGSNPDFLDTTCMESLKIFANISADEPGEIFNTVFRAWQQHRRLRICYDDRRGSVTERTIDPQVLVFFNREWCVKGYCHLKKAGRTFVVSRIVSAEMADSTFSPDMKFIRSVDRDNLLNYTKFRNVKIRISDNVRKFAVASRMHSKMRIIPEPGTGCSIFFIPAVAAEVVVPWILAQQGEAVPLSPPEIVEAVKRAACTIVDRLSGR